MERSKTKQQLIEELNDARRRLAAFQAMDPERRMVGKALKAAQARLQHLLLSSPAVIYVAKAGGDYGVTFMSENVTRQVGYDTREFIDDSAFWVNRVHREDAARVLADLARLVEVGECVLEYRFLHKDGTYRWMRDECRLVRDGDGNPVEIVGFWFDITERRRIEEALRESEATARALLDAPTDLVFLLDTDGAIIDANQAAALRFNKTRDELVGLSIWDLFEPETTARRKAVVDRVIHSGEPIQFEDEREGKWWDGITYPIRDLTGKVSRVAVFARDITERKRAEEELVGYRNHLADLVKKRTDTLAKVNEQLTREIEERTKAEHALRESQQMLQSVLDTIPVRVFWKDLDSNYLGCNRPFARDAGLQSPKEITGRNDFEMGWAEQAELYRADDRSVMETGSPKLGYEEPATVAGDTIWLRTNKVPLLDAEGGIKGVLGTYEDITERKRMEEMLRVSETKYRIVADNTYDWEYWTSPEGRFLYTSPSCHRITGYTASEFQTDPELLSRIVHPDDLAQFKAQVEQDQTTSASGIEFRIIHRDGTTRWIGHVRQPVFNAQGLFLGRRGSNRDITERKQAEKALEESSQKLKLFAYSVAHDLKSPAIGVYGLTKRLSKYAREVLDEKGRNYCDQILKASEHIATLVDKINTYIATKEARLSIERINIGEILGMLKDEFAVQLSMRRIDWLQPETIVEIKADRLSMLRAFRNFLDNSLKYGGERLSTIWTGYEESEDSHIFSFSDNGKGLKEEDSEKIFRAFQRNETSRGVEGAGLGLTIVKEIAEQHGGNVWVEPRGKKGITFYLSISKDL